MSLYQCVTCMHVCINISPCIDGDQCTESLFYVIYVKKMKINVLLVDLQYMLDPIQLNMDEILVQRA
jgi:hypothetical protein